MKAKDFLIEKLNLLAKDFASVKIRYEFRNNTQTHIIEIIPLSFFDKNDDYIQFEIKLENDFEQLFPSENILFISEDSLTEIHSPDFKLGYDEIIIEKTPSLEFEVKGLKDVSIKKYSFALAA